MVSGVWCATVIYKSCYISHLGIVNIRISRVPRVLFEIKGLTHPQTESRNTDLENYRKIKPRWVGANTWISLQYFRWGTSAITSCLLNTILKYSRPLPCDLIGWILFYWNYLKQLTPFFPFRKIPRPFVYSNPESRPSFTNVFSSVSTLIFLLLTLPQSPHSSVCPVFRPK